MAIVKGNKRTKNKGAICIEYRENQASPLNPSTLPLTLFRLSFNHTFMWHVNMHCYE